jgi:hypothetical protein
MKKLLALALSLSLLASLSSALLRAADADSAPKKRAKPTEEQRKLRKELLEKYDANKDGKLDKTERAKISKEDQEKMEKAGLARHGKNGEDHDKKDSAK